MSNNSKKDNIEKGSVLVLTLVAVMILSIMVTGLLTVGTTEIYTTQNYQLKRNAYYAAVAGMEEIRKKIVTDGSATVANNSVSFSDINPYIEVQGSELKTAYMTGTLYDYEYSGGGSTKPVEFTAFPIPTPPGYPTSADQSHAIPPPKALEINITGVASYRGLRTKKTAYSEILAAVYVLPAGIDNE